MCPYEEVKMSELDYSLMKVLVIDDQSFIRRVIVVLLRDMGFINIEEAEDGASGLEAYTKHEPDLIICDILMPKLDGYGVLQIISKSPKLEHIPFIFLTAKTHYEDQRKGMELGADDYLSKPFEESELLRAIESRLKSFLQN